MSKKNFFPKPKEDEKIYTPSKEALEVLERIKEAAGLKTLEETVEMALKLFVALEARKREEQAGQSVRALLTDQPNETPIRQPKRPGRKP